MGTILVTPLDEQVWANGGSDPPTINFPPLQMWREVDAGVARAKDTKDTKRIAPPDFEDRIKQFRSGKNVDLAVGGQLRLGTGVPLIVNGVLAFGKFDATHPTRGDHLTPPAGLFGAGFPWHAARDELSEEFIVVGSRLSEEFLVRTADRVGVWRVFGMETNPERAKDYAQVHSLVFDPKMVFEVEPIYEFPHRTIVSFGPDHPPWVCLVEFEPDTSSVELLFPGRVTIPVGWWLVDGEQLMGGDWRNQPIVTEKYDQYPWTSKAEITLRALGGLLKA